MFPRPRVSLLVCLATVLAPHLSFAQSAADTSEGQIWVQALAVNPVSANWRVHLEAQPRWFDDGSELGLTIVRGAVGRRILPRATAFFGYAWVPRTQGEGVRHEQRTWQQLSLDIPSAGRWTLAGRIRLEQRHLAPWDGQSHRLRLMLRSQRPLGGSGWTLATYDEAMVTLDRTPQGPNRGYDRNRVYGGVQRYVSPRLTAEFGYIWENSTIYGPGQRNDHIAIGVLNLTLFRPR